MNLRLQSIGFISVFDDKLSLSCYPNFSFSRGVSTSSFVFVFPPLAKRQKKSIPIDSSSPLISFRCVRYDEL